MKMVVDMDKEEFEKAIKIKEIESSVQFFLNQEYSYKITIEEFLNMFKHSSVIEIMDSIEYDVDESFAKILDRYRIPYSRFILIDEDNEEDDELSILDAKNIFYDLDIYSEFQNKWIS